MSKKREHGSETGTEMVYIVEARSTYNIPEEWNGMTLDNRWRKVHFVPSPIGIKNDAFASAAQQYDRYLGYKSALALAYWFMTSTDTFRRGGYCIETRLVKIKLTHNFSTEEIGVTAPMSLCDAERNAIFTERTEPVDPLQELAESVNKKS